MTIMEVCKRGLYFSYPSPFLSTGHEFSRTALREISYHPIFVSKRFPRRVVKTGPMADWLALNFYHS